MDYSYPHSMTIVHYFIFIFVFVALGTAILEFLFWSIEKLFNYFKEYFFPTPQLPDEIMDAIEQEAHDFVWNMHRVGDEPNFGEYMQVVQYLYNKKYAEYFGH